MKALKPKLYSAECIRKTEKPVLTKDDIPYEASLIFNAGVAKYNGKLWCSVMITDLQKKTYPKVHFKTSLGFAESDDGINWKVKEKTIFDNKNLLPEDELKRLYDPRITIIDNKPYLCMANIGRQAGYRCFVESTF